MRIIYFKTDYEFGTIKVSVQMTIMKWYLFKIYLKNRLIK